MKILSLLILYCTAVTMALGQNNNALEQVVTAEKAFASMAKTNGVTPAFMAFLDDSSKVFEQGKILSGKETWKNRNTDNIELSWYPEFAEAAASGDIGYTTGPWHLLIKNANDTTRLRGYFNTIWKKNNNGEWKALMDIGSPSPDAEYDEGKIEYLINAQMTKKKAKKKQEDIKGVEENFIANYADGKGYMKYGSKVARYIRPGIKVMKGSLSPQDTVKRIYKNSGTGISAAGDLGYAYGYVTTGERAGNYLRVWKKEDGDWKIVLDVATE